MLAAHPDFVPESVPVSYMAGGESERGQYHYTNPASPHITIHPKKEHPAFTTVHEYGHDIDHRQLGTSPDEFGSQGRGAKNVIAAIMKSTEAKNLKGEHRSAQANKSKHPKIQEIRRHLKEAVDPREFFARAYSQYITHKSKHPDLIRGLESERKTLYGKMEHWSDESFTPISKEFDALFASHKSS